MVFTLDTRPEVAKKAPHGAPIWSGVGFSPSGTLLDADMAVMEVSGDGKNVRAMDMHVDEELGKHKHMMEKENLCAKIPSQNNFAQTNSRTLPAKANSQMAC